MSVRIALIRHGQTDWNLSGRMQGRTDIPLNATGREQASVLAERLSRAGGWDAVVTSPLLRARQTAEILAERLGLEAVTCEGLVERSFGDAEGLSHSVALEHWPSRQYPSMEGHDEVAERGVSALDRIADQFRNGRVIAVTHGSFIRHLLADISGLPADEVPRAENLAISEVERDESGTWHVRSIAGRAWEPGEGIRRA
nr:histidine phosphatase family protein [Leucobacter sp. L43]